MTRTLHTVRGSIALHLLKKKISSLFLPAVFWLVFFTSLLSNAVHAQPYATGLPCFVNGDAAGTTEAIITVNYTPGTAAPIGAVNKIATAAEVGSTWGMAYNMTTNKFYASTVIRRHSGLQGGSGGSSTGRIYKMNTTMPGSPSLLMDLNGMANPNGGTIQTGADPHTYPLGGPFDPNNDPNAFDAVGKIALGDIDFDNTTKRLYVINLNQSQLIKINLTNEAAPVIEAVYNINATTTGVTCSGGTLRPWGIEIHGGQVYIGAVCSAEGGGTTATLDGYVFRLNGSNFTQVLNFDLDYGPRDGVAPVANAAWQPWVSTFPNPLLYDGYYDQHPQPIVSDMEILDNGDIVVGVIDRFGLQTGSGNYYPTGNSTNERGRPCGDALRFPVSGNAWNSTPSHRYGDGLSNPENSALVGGLAYLSGGGFNEFITPSVDPIAANTNGVSAINTNAAANAGLIQGVTIVTFANNGFGDKGAAFGDMEIAAVGNVAPVCAITPVSATPTACVPATGNYSVTISVSYANQPAGQISVTLSTGQTVNFTPDGTSPDAVTISNIPATGTAGIDVTAASVATPACTGTGTDLYNAPAACGAPVCAITPVSATPTACVPATGNYSVTISVSYANQPAGQISVTLSTGQTVNFTPDGISPDNVTISNIPAMGTAGIDVTAASVATPACTGTGTDLYNAPAACGNPCAGVNITVTPTPTPVSCLGGANGAITLAVSGGTTPYTYDWADVAGTNNPANRTGLAAGTYTVTVSDANGCTKSASATITAPTTAVDGTIAQTQNTVTCTVNAAVTATGGTPGYTYTWSNGATTATAPNLPAGTFTVTITDTRGCTSVETTTFNGCDWGDNPNCYGTSNPGGPKHFIDPLLKLGACIDGETDGQPEAMAGLMTGGDDNTGGLNPTGTCAAGTDDEDGVTFLTPMIPGNQACVSVTAMNMTGTSAKLQMWVDWNGNCNFTDSGEEVTTVNFSPNGANIPAGGVTNQTFCFNVPPGATFNGGKAHVRFRLSPTGGLTPNTGTSTKGEIEDYKVTLYKIGTYVWEDLDANGRQNEPGTEGIDGVTVELTWGGTDGNIATTGDNRTYTTTTAVANGVNGQYNFCGLTPGTYRVRIPTDPTGFTKTFIDQGNNVGDSDAHAGETFTITQPNLPTNENGTGDNPGAVNGFPDNQDNLTFDFGYFLPCKIGDRVWYDSDMSSKQNPGEPGIGGVTVTLTGTNGIGTSVGPLTTTTATTGTVGMYMFQNLVPGTYKVTFTPPAGLKPVMANMGTDEAIDSDANVNTGMTVNEILTSGEFNPDYDAGYVACDRGDNPPPIPTTGNNGPCHVIQPGGTLYFGMGVDGEDDGLPSTTSGTTAGSGGDDNHVGSFPQGMVPANGDDEDGVVFLTPLIPGNQACISIKTTMLPPFTSTFINAWFDFNGNGTYQPTEKITFTSIDGVTTNTNQPATPAGQVTLVYCFMVPPTATFPNGEVNSRFRISTTPNMEPTDCLNNGEVEDYWKPLGLVGNYVWMDNDIEGDEDCSTEMAIPNVPMTLISAGMDNNFGTTDDRTFSTTTNTNGKYEFRGVMPGNYRVIPSKYLPGVPANNNIEPLKKILTIPNKHTNDEDDSDGNPGITIMVPDLTTNFFPTGENACRDNTPPPNFPDPKDNRTVDFGFIKEPRIGSSLGIKGVAKTAGSGCGKFDVIMYLCIKNTGGTPLNNLQAMLEFAGNTAFGNTFQGLVGAPTIISSSATTNPTFAANYTGIGNNKNLFNGTSGTLNPEDSICIEIRFTVDPDVPGAHQNPKAQAMVSAKAVDFQGNPIPDFYNNGNQYMAMDNSDSGMNPDPDNTNPDMPGDTGTPEDPTPLGNCWQATQQLVGNNHVNASADETCQTLITAAMVLEGEDDECEAAYPLGGFNVVTITTLNNVPVPNPIPSTYIGQTLKYKVENIMTCNSTWGTLLLEDKLPPVLTCTDVTVNCAVSNYTPAGLASLNIAGANPVVDENCSNATVAHDDTFFDLNCGQTAGGISASAYVRRIWTAVDAAGNQGTCTQFIYFQRLGIPDVLFPVDVTVDCSAANTNPPATGAPHVLVNGNAVNLYPNNTLCEMNVAYIDQILPVCDGSYKILRTWTVYDWCSPTSATPPQNPLYQIQVIKVLDTTGPVFACPADMTIGMNPYDCESDFNLPDVLVTDACSRLASIEAKWRVDGVWHSVSGSFADFSGNNYWNPDTLGVLGIVQNLPKGNTKVTYTLTDDCGNTATCEFTIRVEDNIPPVAICTQYTQVSLGGDGTITVPAHVYDQGSYDNCGTLDFKVRRMDANNCQDHTRFDDFVRFCCEDIGDTITVILRVYDFDVPAGDVGTAFQDEHANDCMVQVYVDDKLRPICIAPANVTVACEAFDPALWNYGFATATDNCCIDTITASNDWSRFDTVCNKGTITRTFRTFDCGGLSSTCSQRIFVNYVQDYHIKFPNDVIVTVCDGSGNYGEPQINKKDCELMAVNYEDQVFTVVPDACFKIERTWTILNWCTYDPNGACINVPNPNPNPIVNHATNLPGPTISPLGTPNPWAPTVVRINSSDPTATNYSLFWDANANCYKYKQIIKIIDGQAPQHNGCEVDGCDLTANDAQMWNTMDWWDATTGQHDLCEAPVDLSFTGTDLCSGANVNIHALLFLDTDGDGTMETVINSNALQTYPAGGVLFNNLNNPSYSGGDFRAFDHRPVPPNQIFRFWFKQVVSGTNRTAKLGWATVSESQNAGLNLATNAWQPANAQLPYGTHKIKWFIEDGCGNQSTCEKIFTVKDCKKPTVVCKNGLSTNIMPTGMITIWTSDFLHYGEDNCTPAAQLVYSMRKSGTGTGFPLDPVTGLPVTSLTWNCAELGTQYVELWAKDLAGNADYCETYILIQDNAGNCGPNATVAGFLKTEANQGLSDAQVEVTGSANGQPPFSHFGNSDNAGAYNFLNAVPLSADFVITPIKDVEPLNGVSTYDLLLISKHILGVQPLTSPYKMIAADVNKSGSITTFDIIELRKLVLGIYSDLPNNTSWRFVDKSFQFANPANPFTQPIPETRSIAQMQNDMDAEDFVSIKVGDVNGNAAANNLVSNDDRNEGTLVFEAENSDIKQGETVSLTFRQTEKATAYQFTMQHEGLELLEILPENGIKLENFGVFSDRKAITVSQHGEETGVFTLKFRALKNGKISDLMSVSSEITAAKAWSATAQQQSVALRFKDEKGIVLVEEGLNLYQNQPNPFTDYTVISFNLPKSGTATLSIFDAQGKAIFAKTGDYSQGLQQAVIRAENLPTEGSALFYQLEFDGKVLVKKMIIH